MEEDSKSDGDKHELHNQLRSAGGPDRRRSAPSSTLALSIASD